MITHDIYEYFQYPTVKQAMQLYASQQTASKDKEIEIHKSHIDDQDQLIFDQTQEISELKAEVDRLRKENEEKRSQVK